MDTLISFLNVATVIFGLLSVVVTAKYLKDWYDMTPAQQYFVDTTPIGRWMCVGLACAAWWIAKLFV